ncbi:FecCD family ABC transporter permease [Vibrio atlanticus]|uniref:FecCD family ABC transporter permease n=1 Tax=Vibrio atlanticus TaxID=693153 RepID=UPI003D0EF2C6
MNKHIVIRTSWLSFSVLPKSIFAVLVILAITCVMILASLSLGSQWLSPSSVISELFLHTHLDHHIILDTFRLPRTLMAVIVGAALGTSGLILQSVIRNPLASPDVVGMTSGASAFAIVFLAFFHPYYSIDWLPVFAIAGALLATGLVYLLAWRNGVSPMRMILVGIAMSAVMGAVSTFIIAISPTTTSISAYIWLTGSVYGASWSDVKSLLPWLSVSLVVALFFVRHVNALELGDNLATGLGVSVQKTRLVLILLSVTLAAPAIAYVGTIGFVGLIAPHIARRLVVRSFVLLMPVSAFIGSCLVVLADLCGRMLFQPLDVPAGVFVSAIGAPFFIYLLFRQRL